MIQDFIRTVPNYPIKGVNFYDLNSLFAGPMLKTVIGLLLDKATAMKTPTHIIGGESRGFVLGRAVAYALGLPFVMVRKKGAKYPGKLLKESYELEYGKATLVLQEGLLGHTDRCIIVDDLVATGGSLDATAKLVEQTGAKVLGALAVIDLKYVRNKGDFDYPVHSLHEEWNDPLARGH